MSTVKSKKLQVGTDATSSNNFTIYQPATPDGTLRIGVGNADSPTEVARFDSIPSYSTRAWVNFNGTGTVAIRASGNVSSITDNGTGDYTVNFATAMPDENYDGSGSATDLSDQGLSDLMRVVVPAGSTGALPYTSSNARIRVNYADQFLTDAELITFSVRR